MMPDEQDRFFALVNRALADYVRQPSEDELEAWWVACRRFPFDDVVRALKAHENDPEEGKRAPRPIDVKRRLFVRIEGGRPEAGREPIFVDPNSVAYIERIKRDARSPAVVNTAHAIALRHGNRPWWPEGTKRLELPERRQREPGEEG